MLNKNRRVKIVSASAVALLALTGTAYGTGLAEDSVVNDEQEIEEVSQEEQQEVTTPEEGVEEEVEEEVEEDLEEGTTESGEEETPVEDETGEGDSENSEQDLPEDGEEESDLDEEEPEEEEQEETREVNAELEVPFEDLPIDEETGMLDFVAYHEIANGRAMPRPLTEDEEEYYRVYIEEGYYEEIRTSVTDIDYKFIYVYPQEFYSPDMHTLKYHKYVEIRSELLTLEEQEEFLAEQEEVVKMSEEIGQIYDEELGYFVQQIIEDDYVDHNPDGIGGIGEDSDFTTDPIENENPEQNVMFEEKEVLENLSDYNDMTEEEFKEAYGFNFLFRGVVEEGGFVQEEYKLDNGLTLVVEAESLLKESKGNEDTITLTWGIVENVIRYEETVEGVYQEGQYNLTTNINADGYIENEDGVPNVVATGDAVLREEGKYTPQKVYIEYMENQIPTTYLMVADAVHEGQELPKYSDIVAYIEYGWELGYDIPEYENEGEEDPQDPEDEDGTGNDGRDPQEPEDEDGTDNDGRDPQDPEDDGTDNDGVDGDEQGSGRGEQEGSDEESTSGTESKQDKTEQDDSEKGTTSERFQQTGTSIVWGSILTGLGLGAIGTYFYKKNNKKEEGVDEDE